MERHAEQFFNVVRQAVKVLVVEVLLLLLSGFLPITVQCYAWMRMADKAGGVEMLGEAMSDAPPCELCYAATELQEKMLGDNGKKAPDDRLEINKPVYFKEQTAVAEFFAAATDAPDASKYFSWSARLPTQISLSPETPPPRFWQG